MAGRIEHITVVGGGTAGWMAALFLVADSNRRAEGKRVRVTVIELPRTPAVGVGEATVPAMPYWLRGMGIGEADFMRHCNATFKPAVASAQHPGFKPIITVAKDVSLPDGNLL